VWLNWLIFVPKLIDKESCQSCWSYYENVTGVRFLETQCIRHPSDRNCFRNTTHHTGYIFPSHCTSELIVVFCFCVCPILCIELLLHFCVFMLLCFAFRYSLLTISLCYYLLWEAIRTMEFFPFGSLPIVFVWHALFFSWQINSAAKLSRVEVIHHGTSSTQCWHYRRRVNH